MSSNNRRIQRVPALLIAEEEDEMMKKKKNDYYPKVASIGPYHYGKTELAQVEAFKPFAVDLLVRGREEKDFFYQKVLDMIGQVRNCYEKESVDKYSDANLAQMMLRDASLIIAEMEIYLEHGETYHKRKAMIDHFGRLTGAVLFRDFILVENQIPLYVIQLLIELRHGAGTAPEMINNYVNKCIFGEIRPIVKYSRVPLHLLEFMHIILVCDCVQPREPPTLEPPKPPSKPLEPPKPPTLEPPKPPSKPLEPPKPREPPTLEPPKPPSKPREPPKPPTLEPPKPPSKPLEPPPKPPSKPLEPPKPPTLKPPKPPSKPLEPPTLEPPTKTSNRSDEEYSSGELDDEESSCGSCDMELMDLHRGDPNYPMMAPNHTLMLGSHKHATETSNRSIKEGLRDPEAAPNHTIKLPPKPPTETSNSGKSGGAPEAPPPPPPPPPMMAPNHTLMLGSHKHATETSNRANQESSRGLYSTGGIQLIAANQGTELMAANHTLMIGFAQHATEISNKAKKVTHSFRKVMELKARGIHFRPSATQSLLDVRFKSGFFHATLQLPEMFVSHYSKPFFKNLVAYELLPGVETEPTVTSYINLMQSLVERPEDLEELRERKIVYNQLGSDEEALNVFKDINTHGASDDELYYEVRKKIQKHYNNRIKTWIAELIHTHFRSPWTFIAFLAAAAIIALTAAQLYYGVHPVADKTPTSS